MSRELAAMEPGTGRGGGPQAAVQVGGESIRRGAASGAWRDAHGATHEGRSRRTLRAGSSRVLSSKAEAFVRDARRAST